MLRPTACCALWCPAPHCADPLRSTLPTPNFSTPHLAHCTPRTACALHSSLQHTAHFHAAHRSQQSLLHHTPHATLHHTAPSCMLSSIQAMPRPRGAPASYIRAQTRTSLLALGPHTPPRLSTLHSKVRCSTARHGPGKGAKPRSRPCPAGRVRSGRRCVQRWRRRVSRRWGALACIEQFARATCSMGASNLWYGREQGVAWARAPCGMGDGWPGVVDAHGLFAGCVCARVRACHGFNQVSVYTVTGVCVCVCTEASKIKASRMRASGCCIALSCGSHAGKLRA